MEVKDPSHALLQTQEEAGVVSPSPPFSRLWLSGREPPPPGDSSTYGGFHYVPLMGLLSFSFYYELPSPVGLSSFSFSALLRSWLWIFANVDIFSHLLADINIYTLRYNVKSKQLYHISQFANQHISKTQRQCSSGLHDKENLRCTILVITIVMII